MIHIKYRAKTVLVYKEKNNIVCKKIYGYVKAIA